MVSGQRRLVAMATAGMLGACCLAVAGCGSGSSGAPDPLANLSGEQVMAMADANLKAASSLTIDGTGIATGMYIRVYMALIPGKGCTGMETLGAFGEQGAVTYIVVGGHQYYNLDSAMWQSIGGPSAATIAQRLGGKYIEDPQFVRKLHLQGLGNCAISVPQHSTGAVTKSAVTTLNGVQVVPLKDSSGGVLYVTDTSKPEEVQYNQPPLPGGTGPAGETILKVEASVKVTPPPANQVVSGASIHF